MKKSKKDIVKGKVNLTESDLDIKKAKVRVNTWIDGDIVLKLKKEAKKMGKGYQTLLNETLREALLKEKSPMKEILNRLDRLEQKVG